MKKIVKKWGDSLIVTISPEDAKIYNLKEGSIIDMEIKREGDGDEC